MKKITLMFGLVIAMLNIFGQSNTPNQYEVRYELTQIVKLDTLGFSSFPVTMQFSVTGDKSTSTTIFATQGDEPSNEDMIINMPEKITFDGKKWLSFSNGIGMEIEITTKGFTRQLETKSILGYLSTKYKAKSSIDGTEVIFWICEDLPETISPSVLPALGGAVLELEYPNTKVLYKAISIKKL